MELFRFFFPIDVHNMPRMDLISIPFIVVLFPEMIRKINEHDDWATIEGSSQKIERITTMKQWEGLAHITIPLLEYNCHKYEV